VECVGSTVHGERDGEGVERSVRRWRVDGGGSGEESEVEEEEGVDRIVQSERP
jgi:hypothetical protein